MAFRKVTGMDDRFRCIGEGPEIVEIVKKPWTPGVENRKYRVFT